VVLKALCDQGGKPEHYEFRDGPLVYFGRGAANPLALMAGDQKGGGHHGPSYAHRDTFERLTLAPTNPRLTDYYGSVAT